MAVYCVTFIQKWHSLVFVVMSCILNHMLYAIMVAFEECSINFGIYASLLLLFVVYFKYTVLMRS